MNIKYFAERINKELNSAGFPLNMDERSKAFAKSFKINAFQASAVLQGKLSPSETLLAALSDEFEVPIDVLMGNKQK